MTESIQTHLSTRAACFLKSNGLTPASIARPSGSDVPMVTLNGERNLWTYHFTRWVKDRLIEWGGEHYQWKLVAEGGHDAFDAWLEARVNGGTP
jgi:hypothetical protein